MAVLSPVIWFTQIHHQHLVNAYVHIRKHTRDATIYQHNYRDTLGSDIVSIHI